MDSIATLAFHGLVAEPFSPDSRGEFAPTVEDEDYYFDMILSGIHDDMEEARASWMEDCYDPDICPWMPGDERGALDDYERSIYGD